jgi:hypothetical protein
MKLLANPLGCQKTTAKWLVITQQKTLGKSLVIPPYDFHSADNAFGSSALRGCG